MPLSELAATLKSITSEPIKLVYDAISLPETQAAAYDALAPGGTLVLVLRSTIEERKQKDGKEVEVVQVYGNAHDPGARAVGVKLYGVLTGLLEVGDTKVRDASSCCWWSFADGGLVVDVAQQCRAPAWRSWRHPGWTGEAQGGPGECEQACRAPAGDCVEFERRSRSLLEPGLRRWMECRWHECSCTCIHVMILCYG